jgi:enamine deaminase RidA (YjgF/YER057c/UK114 family)
MRKVRASLPDAPAAIGPTARPSAPATRSTCPGQIPLDPATMELVDGPPEALIRRVLDNLPRWPKAAGGTLDDVVKLNVFLTDLGWFGRSTRSCRSTSASRSRRARRSASPACPRARRWRWTRCWCCAAPEPPAGRAVTDTRLAEPVTRPARRRPAAGRTARTARRTDHRRPAVPAAAALRGSHARGADRQLAPGARAVCEGEVELAETVIRRRRQLLVRVADGTGRLTLRFFHFSRQQAAALTRGQRLRCSARCAAAHGAGDRAPGVPPVRGGEPPAEDRLTPVYPLTEGLRQGRLRALVGQALATARARPASRPAAPDLVRLRPAGPDERTGAAAPAAARRRWPGWPNTATRRSSAWRSRNCWRTTSACATAAQPAARRSAPCRRDTAASSALRPQPAVPLTGAQRRVLDEILADLAGPNRCCGWCRATSVRARPWSLPPPRWPRSRPAAGRGDGADRTAGRAALREPRRWLTPLGIPWCGWPVR